MNIFKTINKKFFPISAEKTQKIKTDQQIEQIIEVLKTKEFLYCYDAETTINNKKLSISTTHHLLYKNNSTIVFYNTTAIYCHLGPEWDNDKQLAKIEKHYNTPRETILNQVLLTLI